jgi:Putative DNA-binding domain
LQIELTKDPPTRTTHSEKGVIMLPLQDWDAAYMVQIATPDESAEVEKKGSAIFDPVNQKNLTRAELAKQVCAFANSGDGFLVYGINKAGGLDAGVQDRDRGEQRAHRRALGDRDHCG